MVTPLDGIKILDMSKAFATFILGDLGADILKIEEAGPVEGRRAEQAGAAGTRQRGSRTGDPYNASDRNKRSIALNLKTPEGREIFYGLAKEADVVVEMFRPGTTKRLGIDYETLSKMNPRLIYCPITGFGQDGPYAGLVGHDITYISLSGALGTFGQRPGGPPNVIPQNYIADWAGGGLQPSIGILAALMAREKTGRGQMVDASMFEGAMTIMAGTIGGYLRDHKINPRGTELPSGGMPYYSVYECADGKYISIGAAEPWFYANLCRAMECEEFIPHQHTTEKHEEIRCYFEAKFKTQPREHWWKLLRETDVVVGNVYELDELEHDPQIQARKMITYLDHPELGKVPQVGVGLKFSDTPGEIRSFAPGFGEHTDQVLGELGYDGAKISDLRERGIVD